jgi:hypothetical protein
VKYVYPYQVERRPTRLASLRQVSAHGRSFRSRVQSASVKIFASTFDAFSCPMGTCSIVNENMMLHRSASTKRAIDSSNFTQIHPTENIHLKPDRNQNFIQPFVLFDKQHKERFSIRYPRNFSDGTKSKNKRRFNQNVIIIRSL